MEAFFLICAQMVTGSYGKHFFFLIFAPRRGAKIFWTFFVFSIIFGLFSRDNLAGFPRKLGGYRDPAFLDLKFGSEPNSEVGSRE